MNSIALIRDNLERSQDIVLARIEEMRDHAMVPPTPRGGCHTLWTLGHLAYIESLVIRTFMLGEPNPLAHWEETFDGAEVSTAAGDFPGFDEVRAECRGVRRWTLKRLGGMSERHLDAACAAVPEGVEHLFGTYRRCFQYASDHWYMHRGQLADCRRAAGIDRMWF